MGALFSHAVVTSGSLANPAQNPGAVHGSAARRGDDFRGILYPGVMLTRRPESSELTPLGDPENAGLFDRLENDLVERFRPVSMALWQNRMSGRNSSVCVVTASGGYPGGYAKGMPIHGLEEAALLPTQGLSCRNRRQGGKRSLRCPYWASLRGHRFKIRANCAYCAVEKSILKARIPPDIGRRR